MTSDDYDTKKRYSAPVVEKRPLENEEEKIRRDTLLLGPLDLDNIPSKTTQYIEKDSPKQQDKERQPLPVISIKERRPKKTVVLNKVGETLATI